MGCGSGRVKPIGRAAGRKRPQPSGAGADMGDDLAHCGAQGLDVHGRLRRPRHPPLQFARHLAQPHGPDIARETRDGMQPLGTLRRVARRLDLPEKPLDLGEEQGQDLDAQRLVPIVWRSR